METRTQQQLDFAEMLPESTLAERTRAFEMLNALAVQHEQHCVVVPGDPPSKARPRFNKSGRAYTPRKTVQGEERYAWMFKRIGPLRGNVAVACLFFRATRQRIDVDNLLKAVLDAGTRARIWDDDSQVTALTGVIEHDREYPRAIIAFGSHKSSLSRGEDALVACERCGKRFSPAGKRRDRARWCSRECMAALAEPIICPMCKRPFRRRSANQKFCSGACRGKARSENAKLRTHCGRGHELTETNARVMADGRRRCLRCQADNARDSRARAKSLR